MHHMAKIKKQTAEPEPEKKILFRPELPGTVAAIDEAARLSRRSRNQMIQFLIEDSLSRMGLWPPGTMK